MDAGRLGLAADEPFWYVAADVFAPVYKRSRMRDGYVSIEVSPRNTAAKTVTQWVVGQHQRSNQRTFTRWISWFDRLADCCPPRSLRNSLTGLGDRRSSTTGSTVSSGTYGIMDNVSTWMAA